MFHRNKRILWLLNHKTLMPYEAQLLLNLGFEVFVPKVIPKAVTFRSGAVDSSYDASLTIPKRALLRLNEFNFYEEAWPADIVTIVNRYFGTAFTIPYKKQIPEVLDKFEGQVVFRAFGLDNTLTYKGVLYNMYGYDSLGKIYNLGDRFWFGEGYEQLHECEPPLLAERALFLPIGVPASFFKNANQWNGSIKKILFVCPNVVSNPYYSAVYQQFKNEFGDLPHVIVGAQDVKVNDPSMLGYVTDEELHQLYLDCAVLYYPSTELRHVHYSPIEAVISGIPIVFFRKSLLGRLNEASTPGCVDSLDEARTIIKRVIDGDLKFIDQLRKGQRNLSYKFSDAYCRTTWKKNLIESGFRARLQKEGLMRVWTREALRYVLTPIARGLAFVPSCARLPIIPPYKLRIAQDDSSDGNILEEGIDFSVAAYPEFVLGTSGISEHEHWGRWSIGKKARIFLSQPLPKKFGLLITGGAYGPNLGKPFKVCIGSVSRFGTFRKEVDSAETLCLPFSMSKPATVIEIIVPHPTEPAPNSRAIGLGLIRLQVVESLAAIPSPARFSLYICEEAIEPTEK